MAGTGQKDAWENRSPSDFFRQHPVNGGILRVHHGNAMGKQASSNLKSKKLCNLSHFLFSARSGDQC